MNATNIIQELSNTESNPINVQIRTVGEFASRRKVFIKIPAVFSFEDPTSTKPYYEAWKCSKNLPKSNPFYEAVQKLKAAGNLSLRECVLSTVKGVPFIVLVGDTGATSTKISRELEVIFGPCSFDTL